VDLASFDIAVAAVSAVAVSTPWAANCDYWKNQMALLQQEVAAAAAVAAAANAMNADGIPMEVPHSHTTKVRSAQKMSLSSFLIQMDCLSIVQHIKKYVQIYTLYTD
jgi:hypothetical protein